MKTVKSASHLKQMALRTGATVTLGREQFNTAGVKAATKPIKAPQIRQQDPIAPAPVDLAPLALAQERVGSLIAQAIASATKSPAPVREWLFTVQRDKDGLLTAIHAKAVG